MTNETEAPELLPCPFCGGAAQHTSRSNSGDHSWFQNDVDHWIFCETANCYVHVGMCETREEAVDAWNTRITIAELTTTKPKKGETP